VNILRIHGPNLNLLGTRELNLYGTLTLNEIDSRLEDIAKGRDIALPKLPRLADFMLWVTAAEPALGWSAGTAYRAYEKNRTILSARAIDADVVGMLIPQFVDDAGGSWKGTATELMDGLRRNVKEYQEKHFPQTPNALRQRLNRLIPDLRKQGISMDFTRKGHSGTKKIIMHRFNIPASASASGPRRVVRVH
jgi:hypothetical protein